MRNTDTQGCDTLLLCVNNGEFGVNGPDKPETEKKKVHFNGQKHVTIVDEASIAPRIIHPYIMSRLNKH